jgi:hypothetical protein
MSKNFPSDFYVTCGLLGEMCALTWWRTLVIPWADESHPRPAVLNADDPLTRSMRIHPKLVLVLPAELGQAFLDLLPALYVPVARPVKPLLGRPGVLVVVDHLNGPPVLPSLPRRLLVGQDPAFQGGGARV